MSLFPNSSLTSWFHFPPLDPYLITIQLWSWPICSTRCHWWSSQSVWDKSKCWDNQPGTSQAVSQSTFMWQDSYPSQRFYSTVTEAIPDNNCWYVVTFCCVMQAVRFGNVIVYKWYTTNQTNWPCHQAAIDISGVLWPYRQIMIPYSTFIFQWLYFGICLPAFCHYAQTRSFTCQLSAIMHKLWSV